jgi:hypothetical protein
MQSSDQFARACKHLGLASNAAFAACALEGQSPHAEIFARSCIEDIKGAATALGYELVQRVTPAARDGGRPEVPEGWDA